MLTHLLNKLNLPLFIHFQKSGDKVITSKHNLFSIDWSVICYLAGLSGVDFIHAGMWGGYMSDNKEDLKKTMSILHERNVIPALSCGMNPVLAREIRERIGNDFMASVGGWLHTGDSLIKKVQEMRKAMDT